MADKLTNQTTSNNMLDATDESINSAINNATNKNANKMKILTNLGDNLSESYQLVKLRQRQYMELAMSKKPTKITTNTTNNKENNDDNDIESPTGGESTTEHISDSDVPWEIVKSAKNKLKRKKTMSASLTSVTDTVNQEKRTRIEGMHLNCRGRLPINGRHNNAGKSPTPLDTLVDENNSADNLNSVGKNQMTSHPRFKRKLQDNAMTIQKLTALTDQLRVEINELKSNLHSERGAVRVLRAQNESETRKWKTEIRKLQNTLALLEKSKSSPSASNSSAACSDSAASCQATNAGVATISPSVNTNEINKLKNEIQMLKKSNKFIDEKKLITNDAHRRKAADIRLVRDSYESRLTQLQKSAKNEITRLLEEIKTKERNIGQLRNEVKILKSKTQKGDIKRKNATNPTINTSVKSTTQNKQINSHKSVTTGQKKIIPNNGVASIATQTDGVLSSSVMLNEMTQLREVSPFDSTSNLQGNTKTGKTLKIIPVNEITKTATTINQINNNNNNNNNYINNNNSPHSYANINESDSINEENHINNFMTNSHSKNEELQEDDCEECKIKYNHDSDSAVSSAPPSISPQPSSGGPEAADIWKTVRNFNNDLEKWQQKNEVLEQANQQLLHELETAKESILYLEQLTKSLEAPKSDVDLAKRLKHLEDLANQLQEERNELREQNELLEFRIIELEETNDKWSTQNSSQAANDVWSYDGRIIKDSLNGPFSSQMLEISETLSQLEDNSDCENCQDLIQRIAYMLKNHEYNMEDRGCLQQVIVLLQQTQTTAMKKYELNSEDAFDCNFDINEANLPLSDTKFKKTTQAPRIVATVQPYTTTEQQQHQSNQAVPQNSPVESPRKTRTTNLQTNSLSESGVFVDYDLLNESIDPATLSEQSNRHSIVKLNGTSNLSEVKHLQYYKERLEILESKVLVYESSGNIQAKHLADRLQREVQLEKERNELIDRVEYLESENIKLEEEKCEFEEAENDTRLRLQRLEVDLEILGQRNVELELSREAFCAKYKDCRTECQNLRDDLVATENQIQYLDAEKQLIKENFEFLSNIFKLLLVYYNYYNNNNNINNNNAIMGNIASEIYNECLPRPSENVAKLGKKPPAIGNGNCNKCPKSVQNSEIQALREEAKCLRQQIRQINIRHYEALESADSHWSQMEQQYKTRENVQRNKEACLKQKICKLQDCLREDACAANEKITQLEEQEKELQCCLIRLSKENTDMADKYKCAMCELEKMKGELEKAKVQTKPAQEELECERKRAKAISDELSFLRKLHQETETSHQQEMDCVREQLTSLRKEYLHIEVTNSELREEVSTLEHELCKLQHSQKECCEKIRCLSDEVRNKDEMLQKLECNAKKEVPAGKCLAQELKDECGSPSKRCKLEPVDNNLQAAAKSLGEVLESTRECTANPVHKQFQSIAQDVKMLADCLLGEEKVRPCSVCPDKPNEDPIEEYQSTMPRTSQRQSSDISMKIKEEMNDDENSVTVGMVLLPALKLDPKVSPISLDKKKIAEVPSDMRKLAPQQLKDHSEVNKTNKISKTKSKKRFGFYKTRTASLKFRVQRVVSNLTHKKLNEFHDASEMDMYSSEILQRNVSFASFHSAVDVLEKSDNFINNNLAAQAQGEENTKSDKGTKTEVEKMEVGVQANENPDMLLMSLPYDIRVFLSTIRSYLPGNKDDEVNNYNRKVLELWEHNVDFQEGLKILQGFMSSQNKEAPNEELISFDNYEKYVVAIKCMKSLQSICKPFDHPLLTKADQLITERLMQFHSRKMQDEFYCQVYYPIERQTPKLFIKKH